MNSNVKKHNSQSLQTNDWQPNDRIERLLANHNAAAPSVGAERALHYTEFFRKQAAQYPSVPLRLAHALKYHLEKRSISIHEDEIIVGSHTEHRIGAICYPELSGTIMLEDLRRFAKREVNPLYIKPEHKRGLLWKVALYWLLRALVNKSIPFFRRGKFVWDQMHASYYIINESGGIAHFCPDYAGIINSGTDGLRWQVEDRLSRGSLSGSQEQYLRASLVALEAIESFADRYADLARETGRADIAAVFEQVPRRPAQTLREALQMIWLFQIVIQIESLDQGISLGRIDQYLWPLVQKELQAGELDADGVRETIAAFCIKLSEVIPLFSSRFTEYFAGLPSGQALTLGGQTESGDCAANQLTMLFLDVAAAVKTRQPNWHARISENSGREYTDRLFGILCQGGGSPALYNDSAIMPALARANITPSKVWNYATVGCVEPSLPGETFGSSDAAILNVAMAMELVLGEGKRLHAVFGTGRRNSSALPLSGITDFDTLLSEIRKQIAFLMSELQRDLACIETGNARHHPTPFSSLTIRGCIESAKDATEGGAQINASGIQLVGLADLADSLYAIRELVFETKQYALNDFAKACRKNFRNARALHAHILKLPKFGNDHKIVDSIAAHLVTICHDLSATKQNTRGGPWLLGGYSMTCHRAFGAAMGALPSGRLKGDALADGIAPADGKDFQGPTASLNSSAHLGQHLMPNGVNLNIRFSGGFAREPNAPFLLQALVKGYFSQGGLQIQINMLDNELLLDAMKNPDKHRNLLVRVSGYCAFFTDLPAEMQREIIRRSAHVL